MKRWERRAFNAAAALVVLTGAVYAWMQYVLVPDDPFAVVNHPWQPAILAMHVVFSPPFILLFGIIFNSHVMRKLQGNVRPNRKTGYVSLATFAAMVASGYLLQVVTGEALLKAMLIVHLSSGALFATSYTAHLVITAWLRRPVQRPVSEAPLRQGSGGQAA
jgi:hypothetical protein